MTEPRKANPHVDKGLSTDVCTEPFELRSPPDATVRDVIKHLPGPQRMPVAVAFHVLRRPAPSEQYEIGRAQAVVEMLEAYGIPDAERIVSRWSNEGEAS